MMRNNADRRPRNRDRIFDALRQVSKEGAKGQPLMVERFRTVAELAEELVAQGVPFATCRNSRMNKEIRKRLNDDALQTTSSSKSRKKQIKGGAVESWLKKAAALRSICDHFINMGLYGD